MSAFEFATTSNHIGRDSHKSQQGDLSASLLLVLQVTQLSLSFL